MKDMDTLRMLLGLLHRGDIAALLVFIAGVNYAMLRIETAPFKRIFWIVNSCIFGASLLIFIQTALSAIFNPQVWDFTAFYLYGKVAAQGHDYYSPDYFQSVYQSLSLPDLDYREFEEEIVPVGFLYPPPTIFLFIPLGYLSYKTALISWTIFNLIFAAGSIWMIYDLFFKTRKLNGFLLAGIMFFLLDPVHMNLRYSQTNFILLFLLLLMYKYSDRNIAGIFLALAFFIKPYMIIFGLFFLLMKRWKVILYFAGSLFVGAGLTFIAFGKLPFTSYLFNNPSKRLPGRIFSEEINQSLHAVLLRNHLITLDSPLALRLVVAGILVLLGIYLVYLFKKRLFDYIWMVLLLAGLLIYPGTLSYYGVLLLFIVCFFFDEGKQFGLKNIYMNAFMVGIFYYLSSFSVFMAICFLLMVIFSRSIIFAYPGSREIKTAFQNR